MHVQTQSQAFFRSGFATISSVIAPTQLSAINLAIEGICREFQAGGLTEGGNNILSIATYGRSAPERNPDINTSLHEDEPHIIGALAHHHLAFGGLLTLEPLWTIASRLLSIDVDQVVYHFSTVQRKPAQIGPAVGWHRDYANTYCCTVGARFVRLLIAITQMGESNGGVWVVPGSHLITDEEALEDPSRPNNSTVYCPKLNAGDVLAIHPRLLHSSTVNRSSNGRTLVMIQFADRKADLRCEPTGEPYAMSGHSELCQPSETSFCAE